MHTQDLLSIRAAAAELGVEVHVAEKLSAEMDPAVGGFFSGAQVNEMRAMLARNGHLRAMTPRPPAGTMHTDAPDRLLTFDGETVHF